jgi:hypothetical protein
MSKMLSYGYEVAFDPCRWIESMVRGADEHLRTGLCDPRLDSQEKHRLGLLRGSLAFALGRFLRSPTECRIQTDWRQGDWLMVVLRSLEMAASQSLCDKVRLENQSEQVSGTTVVEAKVR